MHTVAFENTKTPRARRGTRSMARAQDIADEAGAPPNERADTMLPPGHAQGRRRKEGHTRGEDEGRVEELYRSETLREHSALPFPSLKVEFGIADTASPPIPLLRSVSTLLTSALSPLGFLWSFPFRHGRMCREAGMRNVVGRTSFGRARPPFALERSWQCERAVRRGACALFVASLTVTCERLLDMCLRGCARGACSVRVVRTFGAERFCRTFGLERSRFVRSGANVRVARLRRALFVARSRACGAWSWTS